MRNMMAAFAFAVASAVFMVACNDNPDAPAAPTPPVVEPPPSTPERPPWFDAAAYADLVGSPSRLLSAPETVNILLNRIVVRVNASGDSVADSPCGELEHVIPCNGCGAGAIPYRHLVATRTRGFIEDATGKRWTGRVASTTDQDRVRSARRGREWVVVDMVEKEGPTLGSTFGGGARDGWIELYVNPGECTSKLVNDDDWSSIYGHELGHLLGFGHAKLGEGWLMGYSFEPRFAPDEARHMQYAFEHGGR